MRRKLPPLNSLKAFESAARHLSFTKAADELFVTQGAVSQQVKQLESFLGVPLFIRKNRNLLLTEAGQLLVKEITQTLDHIADITDKVTRLEKSPAITVSVVPSFAAKWLVPRLFMFYEQHPDIEVQLLSTERLVDFNSEDVDVGVRLGNGNYPGLESIKLLDEYLVPVCSPDVKMDSPEDLKQQTLLVDANRPEDWQRWLAEAGVDDVKLTKSHRYNNYALMHESAALGQGVALGLKQLATHDLETGRLIKPFDIEIKHNSAYHIVYPTQDKGACEKVRAFVDWLLAQVDEERASRQKK